MTAPRPMLVKKLIANLVSRGLSRGIKPSQASAIVASRDLKQGTIDSLSISQFNILYFVYILHESKVYLSTNFVIPRNSANSWKSNFMKILELEVVSSSFSLITCSTSQPMASVWRRWEKNFATFLMNGEFQLCYTMMKYVKRKERKKNCTRSVLGFTSEIRFPESLLRKWNSV